MHHRPSRPPLSACVRAMLTRWWLLVGAGLRRALPFRLGRMALGALVTTTVVGLVLAVPVISGVGSSTPSMALDATSSSSAGHDTGNSPVVMGLDGTPTTSGAATEGGAAGPRSSTASSSAADAGSSSGSGPSSRASDAGTAPATTGSAPAGTQAGTSAPRTSSESPTGTPPSAGSPGTGTTSPGTSDPTVAPEEPAEAPVSGDAAAEAVALINGERAAAGCAALVADPVLAATAGTHSAAMGAAGVLGLDGLDLAGLGGAAAVAQGRPTAQSAVAGWLADPTDSAALLDCSRTAIGVGTVDGWWTALLT